MSCGHKSNSSSSDINIFSKIVYWYTLFNMHSQNSGTQYAQQINKEIQDIVTKYERLSGRRASDSIIFEIGFGPRPLRAYGFSSYFKKVIAIDIEHPVLSARDVFCTLRLNGIERALKSCFRYFWFDRKFLKQFHAEMARINSKYAPNSVQLIVADAAAESAWRNIEKIDFVFSTDVFEHIPPTDLADVMSNLYTSVDNHAIIITIPLVFTGICGGHDIDWYQFRVDINKSDSAWGHLVNSDFRVNTYINKLKRKDYVDLFISNRFSIIEDNAILGRLGEMHLTDDNRKKLSKFDEYELFSNLVEFVLKKEA